MAFSAVSEANSDHHHYQWTPCEPINMSQTLVGMLKLRNCRIEKNPFRGFSGGFDEIGAFPGQIGLGRRRRSLVMP
ncbi:hypothetical protein TB2_030737 [Malus domestica]